MPEFNVPMPYIHYKERPYIAYNFKDYMNAHEGRGCFYLRYKGDEWKHLNIYDEVVEKGHYGVSKVTCMKMLKSLRKYAGNDSFHIWLHLEGTTLPVDEIMDWLKNELDEEKYTIVERT